MTQSVVARVVDSEIHVSIPSSARFPLHLDRCRRIPDGYYHGNSKTWRAPATKGHASAIRDLFATEIETCDEFSDLAAQNFSVENAQRWKTEEPDPIPNCPLPPWRHQSSAFHFAKELDACLLYMAMGTGKSAVVIHLIRELQLKKILILSPLSVMHVWPLQFAEHYGSKFEVHVLSKGTSKRKKRDLERITQEEEFCVVINYETACLANPKRTIDEEVQEEAPTKREKAISDVILDQSWDLVVLDESHKIKAPGSKRSMFCSRLRKVAKKRLCLTGTPTPNNNLDYYGQFRFLEPSILGTNFAKFQARYAVLKREEIKGNQVTRLIGFQNTSELAKKISTITFHAGEESVTLPEKHHIHRPITLGHKERIAYEKMNKKFVVWIKENEEAITATNMLVQTLRLQQIVSGFIQDRDQGLFERLGTSKENALSDIVEGIDEPIVVFCQFVEDLNAVIRVGSKHGRKNGEISGRRKDVKGKWKDGDGDVLAVQIQAGGLGIDLTRARYAVYYSLGYSLGDYEQSVKRLHRPGQERAVTYFHLIGENTVEEKIYLALRNKKGSVQELLKLMGYE